MENAILSFIQYLHTTKHSSENTEVSYERDLKKLSRYLTDTYGITDFSQAGKTGCTWRSRITPLPPFPAM